MALRVFSFYFLISNLDAVILRFLEGVRNKTGNKKKNTPHLYVHFPTPWNWRHVYHVISYEVIVRGTLTSKNNWARESAKQRTNVGFNQTSLFLH
jgi:hypothetical protein